MIRVIGLKDDIFKSITENYSGCIEYENSFPNCIEFCEFSFIRTYPDHIEITIENYSDYAAQITFALNDYWRIEIE